MVSTKQLGLVTAAGLAFHQGAALKVYGKTRKFEFFGFAQSVSKPKFAA